MATARFVLRAAVAAAVAALSQAQQQAGDRLQLWWCDASDSTQQFQIGGDGTVRTSGGLCVANLANSTLVLAACDNQSAEQLWTYAENVFMSQTGQYCWNMQSG